MQTKLKKGDHIQFKAQRITVGNPVTAIFLKEDKEWIDVKLTKKLEGMNSVWHEGDEKSFRKILIGQIKVIKQATT